MHSWWRRPIVHFLILGTALFALKSALSSGPGGSGLDASGPIVITAERIDAIREDWTSRTGRAPTPREQDLLLGAEIDDALLLHEARRRGYHRSDSVVQQRLLRNMQFVSDGEERSPEALLEEAYALGMDRSDLVVRRRLIQRIQLETQASVRTPEPTDEDLREYMARHRERYLQPERVRLTHVFLSRDRRGRSLDPDAEALLERFTGERIGPEGSSAFGDPFLFARDLAPLSNGDLARIFGPDFATAMALLPAGRWSGPVESAYGLHLVWIHERIPAAPTPLESVRREVREAVFEERGRVALRELLEALRDQTVVTIEAPASDGRVDG